MHLLYLGGVLGGAIVSLYQMVVAMKAANPNWKPGQKFDTSILDNVTRESVEATLVKMVIG